MMKRGNLRIEEPKNFTENLIRENRIFLLKENNYIVEDTALDGEAPKQLARIYFYERGSRVRKSKPETWNRYIVKAAEKWYPVESVTEFMINRIGQVFGCKDE